VKLGCCLGPAAYYGNDAETQKHTSRLSLSQGDSPSSLSGIHTQWFREENIGRLYFGFVSEYIYIRHSIHCGGEWWARISRLWF